MISNPNCKDLAIIDPISPDKMDIHFGDSDQKTQALPSIEDAFGLIKNKFCTVSLTIKAEMEEF